MAYLGSAPQPSASTFAGVYSQAFNGDGSTTVFTLGRYVAQAANIEVIVNNVQQSPFDGSYSVSGGTSLVFSEAPSSGSNNIYVIYRDYPVQTLTDTGAVRRTGDTMTGDVDISKSNGRFRTIDGSKALAIGQWDGTNNRIESAGANGLLIQYGSGNTFALSHASVGDYLIGDSAGRVRMPYQPAFTAHGNSGYWYNTVGTVPYNVVDLNIGEHYNTSNYRFVAPVSGTYHFTWSILTGASANSGHTVLRKNGTPLYEVAHAQPAGGAEYDYVGGGVNIGLSASDWVDIYLHTAFTGNGLYMGANQGYYSQWSGFLIG